MQKYTAVYNGTLHFKQLKIKYKAISNLKLNEEVVII